MSRLTYDHEPNLEQEHFALVGEGLYMASLEKAAADAGMTLDQYADRCIDTDVDLLPLIVTDNEIDF